MPRPALAALFLITLACLGAEQVQIGDGELTNKHLPVEPFGRYNYSQQLYRSEDIMLAGNISSVSFQYLFTTSQFLSGNHDWKIYLGHTTRDSLGSWEPLDSLTQVYDGTLQESDFTGGIPGQGWLNLDLDSLFYYNGTGNLIIVVDENTPAYSSNADDFLCSPAAEVRGIVFVHDEINPDPADPPEPEPNHFFALKAYPNLRLEIEPFSYTPWHPQPPDQGSGIAVDAGFHWQSNASSFDLWLGTGPHALQLVAQDLAEKDWFPSQDLEMLTTYHWQVSAQEGENEYPGPVWSFTTAGEGIGAPQNLGGYFIEDHVQLSWEPPVEGEPSLYRVIRNDTFLNSTEDPGYQDFEVSPGQVWYYYVLAQNHLGEVSGPSNQVTVHIPEITPNLILGEDFEDIQAFTQAVPGWQNLDLDGSDSWEWNGVSVPGLGGPLAWLVFQPQQTVPPLAGINAHGGASMLASLACLPPPNNDWLISPPLQLGNSPSLSFWARSHTTNFGLERLRVLISTGGSALENFVLLNDGNWISVPAQWTEYSYDLTPWQGQSARLAFNCVSWDAQALYLDDILIVGEGGYVPVDEELASDDPFQIHPNPSPGFFKVENSAKTLFGLALYDLRGRKLFAAENLAGFHSAEHCPRLAAGIYILRLESQGQSWTRRLAIIK